MDEELSAGSSPESGGQWPIFWMETGDEWCLSGVDAGADTPYCLISSSLTWIAGLSAPSAFADATKLWGAVDTPQGWDAIQSN